MQDGLTLRRPEGLGFGGGRPSPTFYRRQPIANKTYYFEALVERTCTDTISVAVQADGPQQAKALAHKALLVYPSKVEGDEVKAILVENRDFRSSAVIDLARKVPTRDQQDS